MLYPGLFPSAGGIKTILSYISGALDAKQFNFVFQIRDRALVREVLDSGRDIRLLIQQISTRGYHRLQDEIAQLVEHGGTLFVVHLGQLRDDLPLYCRNLGVLAPELSHLPAVLQLRNQIGQALIRFLTTPHLKNADARFPSLYQFGQRISKPYKFLDDRPVSGHILEDYRQLEPF